MVESSTELVPALPPAERQATPESTWPLAIPSPTPSKSVQLAARQRLTLDADGAAQLSTIAPDDQPAAWRQRRLVFSSERLADVAAEFNRFNADAIRIDDPELRDLRIGGVFNANDPASLVTFLEGLEGVTVRALDNGTIIVSRSR
jgi:transmembrane sensor